MKRCIVFAAALALTACVAPNGRLGAQLDQYAGRRVSELVAVLGAPSAETAVADQEVYVWGDPRVAMLPQMQTAGPGRDASATQPACTIRVFAGADQRITSWDILGNEETCRGYRERFASH